MWNKSINIYDGNLLQSWHVATFLLLQQYDVAWIFFQENHQQIASNMTNISNITHYLLEINWNKFLS